MDKLWLAAGIAIVPLCLLTLMGVYLSYIYGVRIRDLQAVKNPASSLRELKLMERIKFWGNTFLWSTSLMWVTVAIMFLYNCLHVAESLNFYFLIAVMLAFAVIQVIILILWRKQLQLYGQRYSYDWYQLKKAQQRQEHLENVQTAVTQATQALDNAQQVWQLPTS